MVNQTECNTPGCENEAVAKTRYGWQCAHHYSNILLWDKVEQSNFHEHTHIPSDDDSDGLRQMSMWESE